MEHLNIVTVPSGILTWQPELIALSWTLVCAMIISFKTIS